MKNKIQILIASFFVFGLVTVFNTVKAQQTNVIQEIQINKNGPLDEIRELLVYNFDPTNPDFKQGIVDSEVKFEINEKGKIVNVHSKGDCKNVSKEIESILSHLQYKVNSKKLNKDMLASIYVMPVRVHITE
ncbi:hypothetical protein [Chryseobacterium daecheongense]|uniref:TonB C-terminal domain-containing protein n=1 Tax=Chryseobacterium daecheongense TaxID=192389 RepID=A0A3N0W475_9FLAO|nr:hypothetical protein [Chryseobacterium daecheongense]ROH99873.1 hypothetical protein EGI05_03010 [Chryseobacterium daecheongense]TDX95196.1 hypothetical protein BCF50_0972 [Chryseobacterium daecheongense]